MTWCRIFDAHLGPEFRQNERINLQNDVNGHYAILCFAVFACACYVRRLRSSFLSAVEMPAHMMMWLT